MARSKAGLAFGLSAMQSCRCSSSTQTANSQAALLVNPLQREIRLKSSSAARVDDYDQDGTVSSTATIAFKLADIGEGIKEVEILQFYVHPGDTVQQMDPICEVQSDKANVEITSRFDGVIESLDASVGEMVQVGEPLVHIAVTDTVKAETTEPPQVLGEMHTHQATQDATRQYDCDCNMTPFVSDSKSIVFPSHDTMNDLSYEESKAQSPSLLRDTSKVRASPAVRKLGKENNLDLSQVEGTGPNGRVLKADVLKVLGKAGQSNPEQLADSSFVSFESEEDETVSIRGYNRLMVQTMTESLAIPHMCYADEVNMNAILECRKVFNDSRSNEHKLSVLPFAIKAASLSMKDYPVVNSILHADEMKLTYRKDHNIGVAVDTPRGLAVPVLKTCQSMTVLDIASELHRLKEAAVSGNLKEEDIRGGTFTMSNIGALGGTYMTPIVSAPQVAIGAMGRVQRLPRFVEQEEGRSSSSEIEEVNIMTISWGGDHRVIDGATMARFSNRWKAYMESPTLMMFAMT